MKKSIETKLALYPTPVTVIGTMNGNKPDDTKVRPVLFEFPNYQYLRTGDVIGKCLSFKEAK